MIFLIGYVLRSYSKVKLVAKLSNGDVEMDDGQGVWIGR